MPTLIIIVDARCDITIIIMVCVNCVMVTTSVLLSNNSLIQEESWELKNIIYGANLEKTQPTVLIIHPMFFI